MSTSSPPQAPGQPAGPPKAPPETLALRAAPRPVKRLSKKALAVLLGVSGLAVAGVATWALRPPHRSADEGKPLYSTERKTAAEGLAALPSDYGAVPAGVPALGLPLPGDLGGPIVNAQREGRIGPETGLADPQASAAEQAAEAERERRLQAARAALASPLLAIGRQQQALAATGAAAAAAEASAQELLAGVAAQPEGSAPPGGDGDRRTAFMAPAAADRQVVSSARLQASTSPYTLMAGAVIPAALVTGLNSDLPGQVVATVTAPVYDTVTGRHLLIPQGARLLGLYDSQVGYGEERALVVWTRLILPDGASVALDRMPAADVGGYAGVSDRVDNHWRRLVAGAALSTLLGVGAELAAPQNQGGEGRVIIAGRDGLQDSINQVGQEITRRNLDIKPTITVRPGFPIRVLVNRDLVLRPYGASW